MFRDGFGVPALIRRWVDDRPDAPAVRDVSTGAELTYAQLWDRAGWTASELARRGVAPGDVVAVALGRSADLVVALLGVLRAGAVYLPVDSHAPVDRVERIMTDAGVRAVVGATAAMRGFPPPVAPVEEPVPEVSVDGDTPCYVMYTSGSTGTPKGVVVPHRAVMRLVTRAHHCVVAPGDRCANGANPAFDATTFEIWGALAAGATVVVLPTVLDLPLDDWVEVVRRERIDTMFLTTSLFHAVARERPDAFGSLTNLVVGGEQMEINAVRRVLAAGRPRRLVNGYGPTETTTFAAYFDCTPESVAGLERVPVGFPLQDTALHVLDEELRPVAPGEVGELCIGGPGLALGYLGLPELTAERFVTDPVGGERLYRTGDSARQWRSGAIELLGRRDRQVKLRGFRIELEEVERAAMATGWCEAVVVEKTGEGPTAFLTGFVLPAADAGDDPIAALTVELSRVLPEYMLPSRWTVLSEVPIGPTGKVDRARLLPGDDFGSLGEALRQVWQDVLDVPVVTPDDAFLDLGGNSLTAMQVAARVRQRLDVPIEPSDVLLAGSLADLARQLTAVVEP